METKMILSQIEKIKTDLDVLRKDGNFFLNSQTSDVILLKDAVGKDLSDFVFYHRLSVDQEESILINRIEKMLSFDMDALLNSRRARINNEMRSLGFTNCMPLPIHGEYLFGVTLRIKHVEEYAYDYIKYVFEGVSCDSGEKIAGVTIVYTCAKTNKYLQTATYKEGDVIKAYSVKLDVPATERITDATGCTWTKILFYTSKRFNMVKPGRKNKS